MNLPLLDKSIPSILVYCRYQSMLAQVMNTKDNSKSNKHIERRLKSMVEPPEIKRLKCANHRCKATLIQLTRTSTVPRVNSRLKPR